MIFSDRSKIYGMDVDMNGFLRPSVLLAKMEDAGGRQMEAFPPTNDDLRAQDLAYVLSRVVLRIYTDVPEGVEAEAQTFAGSDSRGLSYMRYYRMLAGGETVAEAVSTWALLNFKENKLLRVGQVNAFGAELDTPFSIDLPMRFAMPSAEDFCEVGRRGVMMSDCDRNRHLNNTKYLAVFCDYTPGIEERRLRGANISFVAQAPYQSELTVFRADDGDKVYFKLLLPDGKLCAEAALYF
ncbi:MAG: hypothetical protein IJU41_03330 [Clostridia bacterium]|nr:hypothetical protein [Clostridia bacterium]